MTNLEKAWKKRVKLVAEAEVMSLRANTIRVKGDLLWIHAIKKAKKQIKDWQFAEDGIGCTLESGEVFKPE